MLKYPKHYRIPHESISVAYGKRYFSESALKSFLKQKDWVVLEKIDGSQFGVSFKNGLPFLQGKNSHIPIEDKRKAYTGAWGWAWKNIEKIEQLQGVYLFCEWMRVQHNLPYDMLDDWVVVFDVYDMKKKRFMDTMKALDFAKDLGFSTIPVIAEEKKLKYDELLPLVHQKKSAFSSSHRLEETRFTFEERQQIQHPRVHGVPRNRFPDGNTYMEGGIFKTRSNLKFNDEKGNRYWLNAGKLVTSEFLEEFSDDSHWTSSRMRENKLASWVKS